MATAMRFEMTMRLLFGEKAHKIAGFEGSPKHRREWLQKATRKLLRIVNELDTTPRHKEILMAELEEIGELLKKEGEVASWDLVYRLLSLSLRLLGFDYEQGAKCHHRFTFKHPISISLRYCLVAATLANTLVSARIQ